MIVLFALFLDIASDIYPWLDKNAVAHDAVLEWKKGFLNPAVYLICSLLAIVLWAYWGKKLRKLSLES